MHVFLVYFNTDFTKQNSIYRLFFNLAYRLLKLEESVKENKKIKVELNYSKHKLPAISKRHYYHGN